MFSNPSNNHGNVVYDTMSAMGASVNMMNGLDMDMSLPMDLDYDLSSGTDQNYSGLSNQQAVGDLNLSSTDPNGNSGSGSTGDVQDALMTGDLAGAGPLPTGFGIAAPSGTSTLTEFTKRRNWSQRIIEELKDFLHILTPDARILYVSPSTKNITGYEPSALIGQFITDFVHPDDGGIFVREFNESIASGNSLRFFYRFKKEDGSYIIFECDGHPHISPSDSTPVNSNISAAGVCRGFFMMARPYPTKNAALLDSFLEHKIENERLLKRVKELKREEQEDNVEQDRLNRDLGPPHAASNSPDLQNVASGTAGDIGSDAPPTATPNYQGMPPPAKPPISNTALTRQNLDSALSSQKPDSIADKMSRYEASNTHLEGIELITGLRYRDGERSHGISTGDTSPALIRGDAGIAILLDRDRDGSKKEKRKMRVADEYVCADCGTLDSPEWRKGPKGPKTLCNACGLRWAKKEKKRGGDDGKNTSPVGGSNGMSAQQPLPSGMPAMPHTPSLPVGHSNGSSNGTM